MVAAKAKGGRTLVAPPQARTSRKHGTATSHDAAAPTDSMSQCVALCQEQRWREAVLLCRRMYRKAKGDGNAELAGSLAAAMVKLEYSLRRQIAGALVDAAKDLLAKEFLLDVGE